MNETFLKKLKKGVIIVNVGRGDVICEKTLAEGIRSGIILGAALDVFEKEPLNKEHEFYQEDIQPKILNFCHKADNGDFLVEIRR